MRRRIRDRSSSKASEKVEVMHEPPGFVRELDRRMAILSVAGRFAAAIGVSAIVALFFVIMVPASRDYARQPEGDASSVSGYCNR